MTRQNLGEGTFPRTVGPHDGMDLTGIDGKIDALQDLDTPGTRPQFSDFQHTELRSLWFAAGG
jgi:hypothetical protein